MSGVVFGIVLFLAVIAGCEQLPEEFVFFNDTATPIEFFYEDPVKGPHGRQEISPGMSFLHKQRPVQLPGDWMFSTIDDEKQFREIFRDGITLVDGTGRRVTLDVKTLRVRMNYDDIHLFSMHIRPDLFEPAR